MLKKLNRYLIKVGVFLITAALIAGMAGCQGYSIPPPPSKDLEIRTWYDLNAVRNNLRGHHTLMNDLNSTTLGYQELAGPTANGGKGWEPIGDGYPFIGNFNGQGYEIRDLFINRPDEGNVGLFGYVFPEGVIENLGLVNANVTGDLQPVYHGDDNVGSLVGLNFGTVNNCHSTGNVTSEWDVGGLVGWNGNGGIVSNCYYSGNVTGNASAGGGDVTDSASAGGLVGWNSYGTVSNSYSTASVIGDKHVGGLVGYNYHGTVSNSFWDTETSGQATSDGGTGKNTTEMQDIATFSGAGWNITAVANPGIRNPAFIWNIVDNVTYPFLSWQA